jgi:hypothetical protein
MDSAVRSTTQEYKMSDRTAVYIFQNAECKAHGFTMSLKYFKTRDEADRYVEAVRPSFYEVVSIDKAHAE